jgi:histidinol dehydrogenase
VLGPIAAELAYGEGLQGHAKAAEFRLKHDNGTQGTAR